MRRLKHKRKLYFLRIPKTAGTSISQFLGLVANIKNYSFFGPCLFDALLREENSKWHNSEILAGHLGILPLQFQFDYFTVVRNPIEQLYSYYCHIKRNKGHYFHSYVESNNLDFQKWLLDDESYNLKFNMQTRYLSSTLNLKDFNFGEASISHHYFQEIFENQNINMISIEKAIETANNAIWFGTTTDLENLNAFLLKHFRVSNLSIPMLNVNLTGKFSFSDAEHEAASKLTEYDEKLFKLAKSIEVNRS